MGALAPIAGLLGSTVAGIGQNPGGGGGALGATPPLDNFFGIDGRFLKAPAGGTALFNNILFSSSSQQVPIDFLGQGFYTVVPPLFGGKGFAGLPARFDLFANNADGIFGIDRILGLESAIRGSAGAAGAAGNAGKAADAAKPAEAAKPADAGAAKSSFTVDELKKMSLGDILKLLA